jgi:hypothetical protein
MSHYTLPIVGGFYRPPALAIVNALPVGTPLFLSAEPDNPADANAVAVWIVSECIPASAHPQLEEELPKCGLTLDHVLQEEQWHLGYIPKEFAKQLRETNTIPVDRTVAVQFSVSNEGKPRVRFENPVL